MLGLLRSRPRARYKPDIEYEEHQELAASTPYSVWNSHARHESHLKTHLGTGTDTDIDTALWGPGGQ